MLVFETEKTSMRKAALITGIAIIVIALSAGIAVGVVDSKLIVNNDSTATMNNIKSNLSLFNVGVFSWLITLIFDIVISWSLYIFLKQVNSSLSLLGAWFRLIYAAILAVAILNYVLVAVLLNSSNSFLGNDPTQLKNLVMLFIIGFHRTWSLGLIIFGLHLFIIGYLSVKSGFIPKLIGILLIIAAFSYICIHIMYSFFPQCDSFTKLLESILSLPMALGELSLGIWMLIKGGKSHK